MGTTGGIGMLNCREVAQLCSEELERPLRLGEQVSIGAHLMMCSGCTNFRKQMKILRRTAKAYSEGMAMTPDLDADPSA